jgi:phosphoribosylformylglycinamidine synthase I
MAQPRILVLRAPGTNCDVETAYAFERAGGKPESAHINRLLENPERARDFQILCLPGGFSYGDDIAAGRILANQIRHHLAAAMQELRAAGGLILGICNGFQVLIKSGILLPDDQRGPAATLTWNDSGRFEDRWVYLRTESNKSVFLSGIESLYLPVAHAEGKFVARDGGLFDQLQQRDQLVLRYTNAAGSCNGAVDYPDNPNGSPGHVAGVSDETGRVLGLMPHPERHIDRTHHPRWTRGEASDPGDGLRVFQNAVDFFA